MRFTFTEDQRLFQRTVRDLLAKEFPPEALRAAWQNADPAARARERWARLALLGVTGLLIEPDLGGLGLDEVDLVLWFGEPGGVRWPERVVERVRGASSLHPGERGCRATPPA